MDNEEATQDEIREAVENLQKASSKLGAIRNPYVRLEAEDYDAGDVVKDVDSNRSGGGNIGGEMCIRDRWPTSAPP